MLIYILTLLKLIKISDKKKTTSFIKIFLLDKTSLWTLRGNIIIVSYSSINNS